MKKLIIIFFILISIQSFSQRLIDLPTATTYLGVDYLVLEPLSSSGNTSKITISDFFTDVSITDSLNVSGESVLSDTVRIVKPMYIAGNLFNGTGIGSAAAGSTGQIQFNTSNVFDADPYLYWHKVNNYLRVKNAHIQDTLKIIDNPATDTTLIYRDSEKLNIESNYVKISDSLEVNKSITLGETTGENYKKGKLYYDTTCQALTFYNDQPDFTWQLSREIPIRFYNNTGSTITNGTLLRSLGAKINGSISFSADLAGNGSIDSLQGVAMATVQTLAGEYGEATLIGQVNGLNTSAFNDNDLLWVGSNGSVIDSAPPPPKYAAIIGRVLYADNDSGAIFMFPIGETKYSPAPTFTAFFEDSTETITNPGLGLYSKITNENNTLFDEKRNFGFTFQGDSISPLQDGNYTIFLSYSFQGTVSQTDLYRIATYIDGVKGYSTSRTASGTNNGGVPYPYSIYLTAGQWISFRVANQTSGTRTCVFTDGTVTINFSE